MPSICEKKFSYLIQYATMWCQGEIEEPILFIIALLSWECFLFSPLAICKWCGCISSLGKHFGYRQSASAYVNLRYEFSVVAQQTILCQTASCSH